jgi:hypothetical protein
MQCRIISQKSFSYRTATIIFLCFVNAQVLADSFVALGRQADPTGVSAAAVEDMSRLAWNTLLSVPAAGNSVSYEFDVATGLPKRAKGSLGPLFTSRGSTIGKGRFSANASIAYFDFQEADGIDLKNGENSIPVATPFGTANAISIVDSPSLLTQFSFTYGVGADLDLTVAVPVISTDYHLRAPVVLGTTQIAELRQSANETSVGDTLLRAKWVFLKRTSWILGTEIGFWLPTGDADNNIGLDVFRFEPTLIFSTRGYPVNFHVNAGANVGDTDVLRNEFRYKIGVDSAILERLTVSAEVLGRQIIDNDRVLITSSVFGVTGGTNSHYTDGVAGLKWNPFGDIILYASAIFALDDTGIRDKITGIAGMEFNF